MQKDTEAPKRRRIWDWLLIGFVSTGLLILFVFDLAVILHFNKKLHAAASEAEQASKAKTMMESLEGRKNATKFMPLWRRTAPARKYRAEENVRIPKPRATT